MAKEAEGDAEGYEREVLALSYSDPTRGLTSADRERVAAATPFVREDCEEMALGALARRLQAVSAGADKAAKVLHARYSRRRYEAEDARLAQAAKEAALSGRPVPAVPAEPGFAGEAPEDRREVLKLVEEIEGQLEEPETAHRREALEEAAKKSRAAAGAARSRLLVADGTEERALRETREKAFSEV